MNRVILMGRLTSDPKVMRTNSDMLVARYTLAIDRYSKKDDTQQADFPSIVAFGKSAEFAEKWLKKGTKIMVEGQLRTGSYEKDGAKVYTTDVIVDRHEFCEKAGSNNGQAQQGGASSAKTDMNGFMNIPEGVDEELPFK